MLRLLAARRPARDRSRHAEDTLRDAAERGCVLSDAALAAALRARRARGDTSLAVVLDSWGG